MKKNILILGIGILVLVGIAAFYSLRSDQSTSTGEKRLIPEKKITHGHGFAVDVRDPNKLYVATHHGLFVLRNGELFRIGESQDDYMGFSVHPTNPLVFYTSGHPQRGGNLGFQKSEDGGFTWEKVSNGIRGPVDFHVMAVGPANPPDIYGWHQGALQRSVDEGKTWELLNPKIPEPIVFVPHPQDWNTIYAVTIYAVSMSKNQGETWEDIFPELKGAGVTALAIDPQKPQTLIIYSRKFGLQKSIDGGITWKNVSEKFNGEIVLFIAIAKGEHNNIVYVFTHENVVYKSSDGGETWAKIY